MRKIITLVFLLLLPLSFISAQLPGECDYISGYPNSTSSWLQFWLRQVIAGDKYQYERNDTININWCHSVLNWGSLPIAVNYHIVAVVRDSNDIVVITYEFIGPDTVLSFGRFVRHQWSFDSTSNWQPGLYQMYTYLIDWPEDKLILEFVVEDVIPVELVLFIAKFVGQSDFRNVFLEWRTATELNNAGWYVERSYNRTDWQRLDWVIGAGTTTLPQTYSYQDHSAQGKEIYYRLLQVDWDGTNQYSPIVKVQSIPERFALSQNYPNPFNSQTKISYALSSTTHVDLRVYNILGEEIGILTNEEQEVGVYIVSFKADDLPSGVYFYVLQSGNFIEAKKMTLTK